MWQLTTFILFGAVLLCSSKIVHITTGLHGEPESSALLGCVSSRAYSSCSWTSPTNSTCSFLPTSSTQCRRESSMYYNGTEVDCSIIVQPLSRRQHTGQWICRMQFNDSVPEEATTNLLVFEPPALGFKDVWGQLTVPAGNPTVLTCEADRSFPIGKMSWQLETYEGGQEDIINPDPPRVSPLDNEPGLYRVEDSLLMEPRPDTKRVHCSYTQENGGEILYTKTISIDLDVQFLKIQIPERIPPLYTGDRTNISVYVDGSPAPEVEWRIQGQRGQQTVVLNQANLETDTYILHPTLQVDRRRYLTTLELLNVSSTDAQNSFLVTATARNGELVDSTEVRLTVDRPWPQDDTPSQANPQTAVIIVVSIIIIIIIGLIVGLTILYGKKNGKWCFAGNTSYISNEHKEQGQPLNEAPPSSIIKHHPYGRPSQV